MGVKGSNKHFICDTIAERDSIIETPFFSKLKSPEGIYVFVKYPDFSDESDGLMLGSDEEGVLNGKLYIYSNSAFHLLTPEVPGGDELPDPTGHEGHFLALNEVGVLVWVSLTGGGDMIGANNLLDVADPDVARNNINAEELGAAAEALEASNTYTDEEIATLSAAITILLAGKSATGHTHTASNITDFQATVSANTDVSALKAIVGAGVTDGDALVNTVSELLAVFSTYPEGVDLVTALAGKANSSHTHSTSDITGFAAAALAAAPAETFVTISALVAAAASKSAMVDADSLYGIDSEASNVGKRFTFTNIKAFLKTYFDTIYTNTSAVATQITTALSGYLTSSSAASTYQASSGKDATGGYAGLTLFKINFKNAANTFTSFFSNSNTAARTYTFQDRDGTIVDNTDLALKAPINNASFTGTFDSATGITNANLPNGINNSNSAAQSQLVVSATNYYITNSNLNLPATLKAGMVIGTRFVWTIAMTKTNAGTGIFQISIYRGTNGNTSDTQDVLQTIGTQTAVVDNMTVDIEVIILTTGATGSYFWKIVPNNKAITATGFGVAVGPGAYSTGTVSGVALNTASLKFGIGFKATTGTPTIVIPMVKAQALNIC